MSLSLNMTRSLAFWQMNLSVWGLLGETTNEKDARLGIKVFELLA
jgi:hypothetical protein